MILKALLTVQFSFIKMLITLIPTTQLGLPANWGGYGVNLLLKGLWFIDWDLWFNVFFYFLFWTSLYIILGVIEWVLRKIPLLGMS